MTYEEFQRHIDKAGLKSNEFAQLLGMNPKSIGAFNPKVQQRIRLIVAGS